MPSPRNLDQLSATLAERAHAADLSGEWPAESIAAAAAAGCWGWVIPAEFGGEGLRPAEVLLRYEAAAAGSLCVALILTQRDAAADLIANGDNAELKAELLPPLARGARFGTVGIAQLTTSKRGPGPALRARPDAGGFRLDGVIPWVTGAAQADAIVVGAVLPDGRQILAAVDSSEPGVIVNPPMELMALSASWTTSVECHDVRLPAARVIRGPAGVVLSGRAPVRPLVVSATGMGLARTMLESITTLAAERGGALADSARALSRRYGAMRERLLAAADRLLDAEFEAPANDIRVGVNDLLVRMAVGLLTLSKGTGYLRSHPAQRLVREALFFLVWSAPEQIQVGTLAGLLGQSTSERGAGQGTMAWMETPPS